MRTIAIMMLCAATCSAQESNMFNAVFDAICRVEDASGEYAGRVHRDGVSYGRCGITRVAVQDCIDNGYLPPGVYDLTNPALADWAGRQYLRLLVKRHGSLWAATCHWNKGREAYAAKVWGNLRATNATSSSWYSSPAGGHITMRWEQMTWPVAGVPSPGTGEPPMATASSVADEAGKS